MKQDVTDNEAPHAQLFSKYISQSPVVFLASTFPARWSALELETLPSST